MTMERRDFLKWGSLTATTGAGCASLLNNPGALGETQLAEFLGQLDDALGRIAGISFVAQTLGGTVPAHLVERANDAEVLAKKTMRSLLLVGTLQELEPTHLAHAGVQQRLASFMGELDTSMTGMAGHLENMPKLERDKLSSALKADPSIAERVLSAVDGEAAEMGVSLKQRARLRAIGGHVVSRLRQSPALMMDEYISKMSRITARSASDAERARQVGVAIGQQLIFGQATSGGEVDAGGLSPPSMPPVVPVPDSSEPPLVQPYAPPPSTQPQPRKKPQIAVPTLTAGAVALGLGAVSFGIGFVTGGAGLLLGITFGVLLGIAGLIALIAGLILVAAGN